MSLCFIVLFCSVLFCSVLPLNSINEPPHDKTNKMTVRPAKTQISLGISPVSLESSLCAQWVVKGPSFLDAENEDSDQTGSLISLRWAHRPFRWFCHDAAQMKMPSRWHDHRPHSNHDTDKKYARDRRKEHPFLDEDWKRLEGEKSFLDDSNVNLYKWICA